MGVKIEKMDRKILLWIAVGALFLVVLFLIFRAGASGSAIQSASGAAKSVASSSAMVGGC